ncbi:GNAT family N-acetyltransferase [Alkalihalobacillus pseudalcaliphilus]|uniref:GNAT family N-acetyltransferase n=1 Tax=Alkalihalobacillus pseudalcaliphilus TaxID=79884 RepID=UPI00064D7BB7|nr:GNAT family N-acetyltransferase [Alkalihalobacillus pseudalcaliphilus]KMK77751.1 phosphinothricin acetyltransferase [Alkalihalobacillus pseudalcaliphilus]
MQLPFQFIHASIEDLPEIVRIYNTTIANRMVTADIEPVSVESKVGWFQEHNQETRPLWVIKQEEQVCGWISFQSFYGRPAYQKTAEVSIYLDPIYRGQGLGKAALHYAIHTAPQLGIVTILGFIFGHNQPSLALFKSFGFSEWGTFPGIAELDGIERDLIILGKRIKS